MTSVPFFAILTFLSYAAYVKSVGLDATEEEIFCNYEGEPYPRMCPGKSEKCKHRGEKIRVCKEGLYRWRLWYACVPYKQCAWPRHTSSQILHSAETLWLTKASSTAVYTNLYKCFKSKFKTARASYTTRGIEYQMRSGEVWDIQPIGSDETSDLVTEENQITSTTEDTLPYTQDTLMPCVWCPAFLPASSGGTVSARNLNDTDETKKWVFARSSISGEKLGFVPTSEWTKVEGNLGVGASIEEISGQDKMVLLTNKYSTPPPRIDPKYLVLHTDEYCVILTPYGQSAEMPDCYLWTKQSLVGKPLGTCDFVFYNYCRFPVDVLDNVKECR